MGERIFLEETTRLCSRNDVTRHGITKHEVWAVGKTITYVCRLCAMALVLNLAALPS